MSGYDGDEKRTHDFLKAKVRIGSCKGPTAYAQDIKVFHHDDMPTRVRERANDVRDWAHTRILKVDRSEWYKGSKFPQPMCERRSMENFVKDRSNPFRYNYRAETLTFGKTCELLDKPTKFHISRQTMLESEQIKMKMNEDPIYRGQFRRTQEMPVHEKLLSAKLWHTGTQLTGVEQARSLDKMTKTARAKTAKASYRYIKEDYLTPVQQTAQIQKNVRKQKAAGVFTTKKSIPIDDNNTDDSKTALTNNQMDGDEGPANDGKFEFKNTLAIEKSTRYKSDKHSGVWEYNKIERKFMWSDTGSFDYASRGDIIRHHNPNAYNFEGPTTFRPLSRPIHSS